MDASQSLHPTDQTLSSFGLGKLADGPAEAVQRHLEYCSDCQRRVAWMSSDSFLDRVRDAQMGAGPSQTGAIPEKKAQKTPVLTQAETLPPGLADNPDYEIKKELGRGGMGVVYLAHNTLMGRDEVLKVMGRQIMERPGVLDRFLREIRAVAKLRHPNIVTAYAATRFGESIVFAMEYVEGLDLSKLVKAKRPLPVSHACNFVYQAALGLQHAHEEGLVHRDIKPANLMLSRKGEKATVKVLDFGLAKVAREEKVDAALTSEGQALGTPDYIAPEQILDAPSADIRADIYSLGGTLYYLLTGRPPFKANSLYDMYQAHISRDADPLNLVRPEVPSELAALVAKMMAKDPARRFQTPSEVAQALTPFFKKGNVAFRSPQAEVSQLGPVNPAPPGAGEVSTPTQPGTDASGGAQPKKATEPTVPEGRWESLIDIRETESSVVTTPTVAPTGRPPWVLPSVGVGVLMFGLFAAWMGGVFKVKTPDGVIVLENVPKDSEILVDGNKIDVKWPGVGEFLEIRAVPGQRKVEVKKEGFTTFGEVVTVKVDESEEVTVRLEPLALDRQGEKEADNGEAKAVRDPMSQVPNTAEVVSGSWRLDREELVQVNQQNMFIMLLGESSYSNYDLKFKAKPVGGHHNFSAIFHYASLRDYCDFEIGNDNGTSMHLQSLYDGKLGEQRGTRRSLSIEPGRWYDVRIEVRGPKLKGVLDNQEIFAVTDDRFTKGRVGLASGASLVHFRDIVLTTPEGNLLWQGPPAIWSSAKISKGQEKGAGALNQDGKPGSAEGKAPDPFSPPKPSVPKATIPPKVDTVTRRDGTAKAQVLPKAITNSIGMKLVPIPAGEFLMGFPKSGPKNPQHKVQITRPFYMGATEVTQRQYKAVTGKGPNNPANLGEMPVRGVTWKDAMDFCDILSEAEKGRSRGVRYRLPSEAEWEYSCRAGSSTTFCFGDDAANLGDFAWYGANSGGKPQPVGQKRPNAWGLHDMHGNVWEWCWEEFDKGNDGLSPGDDSPARLLSAVWRGRGGCFGDGPIRLRSAQREGNGAGIDDKGYWQGFRVVLVQFEPQKVSGTVKSPRIKSTSPTQAKSAATPRADTPYPPDAVEHDGTHYKVFAGSLTWHAAKARCETMGGRLAIVKSDEESRLLTALARNARVEGAWLGASDAAKEGEWVWVDGSPMKYKNWDVEVGQPNNKAGVEHYLMLLARRGGKWSDQPDELIDVQAKANAGFVCEWR